MENCDLVALETGSSVENPSDIYIKQTFWLVGSSGPARHMGRPVARLRGHTVKMSQTQWIWAPLQLPEYYELLQAIQHEFQLFDVLGDGKSRIVIFQLDFVKSSIFDGFLRF